MHQHKYSLTEIESMLPWERDIYVALLSQYLEDERMKQRHKDANSKFS